MAILEAKDVSMFFGELAALDGIDLSVEENEILGLIGPNGAGKTTFFNCVSGPSTPPGAIFYSKDKTSPEWHPTGYAIWEFAAPFRLFRVLTT